MGRRADSFCGVAMGFRAEVKTKRAMKIITFSYDADGFLFEFNNYFIERFGVDSDGMTSPEVCALIESVPDFYYNMPVMPGAHEFLYMATTRQPPKGYAFHHRVLTACPFQFFAMAVTQKKHSVKRNFGNLAVVPVPGSTNKQFYVQRPGDLLIDDFGKNCDEWSAAGGVAIKHENFEQTHQKFFEYMLMHAGERE